MEKRRTPFYGDMTPEESRERSRAYRTPVAEEQAAIDRASGRAPKIVCLICGRGPLDGVALFKANGVFRCSDHLIANDD